MTAHSLARRASGVADLHEATGGGFRGMTPAADWTGTGKWVPTKSDVGTFLIEDVSDPFPIEAYGLGATCLGVADEGDSAMEPAYLLWNKTHAHEAETATGCGYYVDEAVARFRSPSRQWWRRGVRGVLGNFDAVTVPVKFGGMTALVTVTRVPDQDSPEELLFGRIQGSAVHEQSLSIGPLAPARDALGRFVEEPEFELAEPTDVVRKIREATKLPVQDLASMLGIKRRQLYNWLDGTLPPRERIERLFAVERAVARLTEAAGGDSRRVRLALLAPISGDSVYDAFVANDPDRIAHAVSAAESALVEGRRLFRRVPPSARAKPAPGAARELRLESDSHGLMPDFEIDDES
jgi:hypothetical protein